MDARQMNTLSVPFADDNGNPIRLDLRPDGGVELTVIAPERDEWVGMTAEEAGRLRDLLERYVDWCRGRTG